MPIHNRTRDNAAFLDNIRYRYGTERLRDVFYETAGNDNESAANLINENNIEFPSLFVLRPEIGKANLYERLNDRNKCALEITDEILTGQIVNTRRGKTEDRAALAWMLNTGYRSDGLNDHYDQVLDMVAILLAKVHGDRACMRPIAELIFNRHRKGFYTYDLVWAFFEASEPMDLLLLANKLRSPDPRDAALARKLLNFVPCLEKEMGRMKQYQCCARWIRRNRNRLYYTGDSNQQHGNPSRYALRESRDGGAADAY